MKYWWSTVIRDYLTFSKKERIGIIIALFLGIFIYFFLPRFFTTPAKPINQQALIRELASLKITIDSTSKDRMNYNDDANFTYYQPKKNFYGDDIKGELFEFDPNTLNADGWKRLGLKDKTIQTIEHFLQKGYKFRQPDDLKKIYGLKPAQANRLMDYVRIATTEAVLPSKVEERVARENKKAFEIIDINTADTSQLIMLPGIGSKLASRIINFRNKLGGFVSVAQLGETYGLPDSTFTKIRSKLSCENPRPNTININLSDASQLKAHPYISWNIANAIVRYREQHGKYLSMNDLLKIDIITNDVFNKISPYLVIE